jgi:hypothetical protein
MRQRRDSERRRTPRQAGRAIVERRAHARRGISTLALILGFAFIVSCLALAVDVGLLVQRHQQLKTASEASALAGALQLFDGLPVQLDEDEKLAEARLAALHFAAANSFNETKLQLNANPANHVRGDVLAGQIDPLTLGSPFIPARERREEELFATRPPDAPHEAFPLNALLVRTRHSQAGGRGPILFFGSLVGVPSSDIYTESIAAVERRIVGYRPVGVAPVPMLPLVCLTQRWDVQDLRLSDSKADDSPGEAGEADRKKSELDQYSYDARTGLVEQGADGVPEIELVMQTGSKNGQGPGENQGQGQSHQQGGGPTASPKFKLGRPIQFEVVTFGAADPDADALVRQVLLGLGALDLASQGGQVVLGSELETPPKFSTDAQDLQAVLDQIIGQPRLLLLGEQAKAGQPQNDVDKEAGDRPNQGVGKRGSVAVSDFAAGVVVCSLLGEGSITIRIQPVVLNSCTAMPDGGLEPNPWIGKVVLVR